MSVLMVTDASSFVRFSGDFLRRSSASLDVEEVETIEEKGDRTSLRTLISLHTVPSAKEKIHGCKIVSQLNNL